MDRSGKVTRNNLTLDWSTSPPTHLGIRGKPRNDPPSTTSTLELIPIKSLNERERADRKSCHGRKVEERRFSPPVYYGSTTVLYGTVVSATKSPSAPLVLVPCDSAFEEGGVSLLCPAATAVDGSLHPPYSFGWRGKLNECSTLSPPHSPPSLHYTTYHIKPTAACREGEKRRGPFVSPFLPYT